MDGTREQCSAVALLQEEDGEGLSCSWPKLKNWGMNTVLGVLTSMSLVFSSVLFRGCGDKVMPFSFRFDSMLEVEYYRNGGILLYALCTIYPFVS